MKKLYFLILCLINTQINFAFSPISASNSKKEAKSRLLRVHSPIGLPEQKEGSEPTDSSLEKDEIRKFYTAYVNRCVPEPKVPNRWAQPLKFGLLVTVATFCLDRIILGSWSDYKFDLGHSVLAGSGVAAYLYSNQPTTDARYLDLSCQWVKRSIGGHVCVDVSSEKFTDLTNLGKRCATLEVISKRMRKDKDSEEKLSKFLIFTKQFTATYIDILSNKEIGYRREWLEAWEKNKSDKE